MEIGTLRKFLCTLSIGVGLLLGLSIQAQGQRRWRRDDNWRARNYGQIVSARRHRRNRLRQSWRRQQLYTARLNRQREYYRLIRERRFRQRQLTAARIRQVREQRFHQRQLRAANLRYQRETRFHRRQARAAHILQRRDRRAEYRQRWRNNRRGRRY
ncbi:MAG TPA: hypothetical protein VJ715_14755 [Pyrinomonadaceae bacterium]|nr:hypothetical protein [Pyrinomonadaceae bacterium]